MFHPEYLESRQLLAVESIATETFHLVASCPIPNGFALTSPSYAVLAGGTIVPDTIPTQVNSPAITFTSPIDISVFPPNGLDQFRFNASIPLTVRDDASSTLGSCILTGNSGEEGATGGHIPTGFAAFVQSVDVPVVTAGLGGSLSSLASTFTTGPYAKLDAPNASIKWTQDNHQGTGYLSFAIGTGATLTLTQGSATATFTFGANTVTSGDTHIRHINIALNLLEPEAEEKILDAIRQAYPAF